MAELVKRNDESVKIERLKASVNRDLQATIAMAEMFAMSGIFKDADQASKAFARIMLGYELGFAPAASMLLIDFVQGKARLSAAAMASLIQRDGSGFDFRVKTLTNDLVEIVFYRKNKDNSLGEKLGLSSFSKEDAVKAELLRKGAVHDKYPRNMLWARALTNGFHFFTPSLASGVAGRLYGPGELPGDMATADDLFVLDEGDILDGKPVVTQDSAVTLKVLPSPEPLTSSVLLKEAAAVAPAVAELLSSQGPIINHDTGEVLAEASFRDTAAAIGVEPGEHPVLAPDPSPPLSMEEIKFFPEEMHKRVGAMENGDVLVDNDDLKAITAEANKLLGGISKVLPQWKAAGVLPKPGAPVRVRQALNFLQNVRLVATSATAK